MKTKNYFIAILAISAATFFSCDNNDSDTT